MFPVVMLLQACISAPQEPNSLPASTASPAPAVEHEMSAAHSPDGQPHPGEIVRDDQVAGSTSTSPASEIPQRIGWVQVEGSWEAVTRIVSSGQEGQRRITRYGTEGQVLDRTVQAPLRPVP